MRTFPPDGGDADQGKHHDDGEGEGDPEQGRVLLGECRHRWDEEEPDEAHCDNKLHSEDRVHLQIGDENKILLLNMAPLTFLMKLSLMALSEKLLPIPPYPPSSPPCVGESDLNILSRKQVQ